MEWPGYLDRLTVAYLLWGGGRHQAEHLVRQFEGVGESSHHGDVGHRGDAALIAGDLRRRLAGPRTELGECQALGLPRLADQLAGLHAGFRLV